jgi:hypothetical protein
MTVNTPRSTTIPPQTHHQKTAFNHAFLAKPPAKTHKSPSKNKRPDKVSIGPSLSSRSCEGRKMASDFTG